MEKKILVPLGPYDHSEEMIPYIEKVARPGTKLLFLLRYPADGVTWQKEGYGMRAALEAKKLVNDYSWEGNLEKLRQRLAPVCDALRANGIPANVEVYTGSLNKVIRTHTVKGDVHLIMTRAGMGNWIMRLIDDTISIFRSFKRPSFSPVMLINPREFV